MLITSKKTGHAYFAVLVYWIFFDNDEKDVQILGVGNTKEEKAIAHDLFARYLHPCKDGYILGSRWQVNMDYNEKESNCYANVGDLIITDSIDDPIIKGDLYPMAWKPDHAEVIFGREFLLEFYNRMDY